MTASRISRASGDDSFTLPLLALGAEGLIPLLPTKHTALMSQMINLALEGTGGKRALALSTASVNGSELHRVEPRPVKAALAMMGLIEEFPFAARAH